jgi:hypothetical protein
VAAYEFMTGPLLADPYKVGKRLLPSLDDRLSARRGTYRIIYRVDDRAKVGIRHRGISPGPGDRRCWNTGRFTGCGSRWPPACASGIRSQSSPENRSHAACFETPSASPMRVQLMPRPRRMAT